MHPAGALPRYRQILVLDDVQFGGRAALAHRKHVNLRLGVRRSVVARTAHVHRAGQDLFGTLEIMHIEHDRTEAANLMLRRHHAFLPWRGGTGAAVVDQYQTLAFAVLKRQRQPAVDFSDTAGVAAGLLQPIAPVGQALVAGDAQGGPRNAVGAALLRGRREIEEGQIRAGIGLAVRIEQVVGADIILVDGLLHQPHAEQAGVKRQIVAWSR